MSKRIEAALEEKLHAIQMLCEKNAMSPDEVQAFQDQFISDILDIIQVQHIHIAEKIQRKSINSIKSRQADLCKQIGLDESSLIYSVPVEVTDVLSREKSESACNLHVFRFVCSKAYEVHALRNYLKAMQQFECNRSGISIEVNLDNHNLIEQCDILKDNIMSIKKRQASLRVILDSMVKSVNLQMNHYNLNTEMIYFILRNASDYREKYTILQQLSNCSQNERSFFLKYCEIIKAFFSQWLDVVYSSSTQKEDFEARFSDVSSFEFSDLSQIEEYIDSLHNDLIIELKDCAISELSKIKNLIHPLFGGFLQERLDALTNIVNGMQEITIPDYKELYRIEQLAYSRNRKYQPLSLIFQQRDEHVTFVLLLMQSIQRSGKDEPTFRDRLRKVLECDESIMHEFDSYGLDCEEDSMPFFPKMRFLCPASSNPYDSLLKECNIILQMLLYVFK